MNFFKKSVVFMILAILCLTVLPSTAVLADGESQVVSEVSENAVQENEEITVGSVLVYIFVGLAGIGGVSYVIIAVKRKNKRPAGSHMPKISHKYMEDD